MQKYLNINFVTKKQNTNNNRLELTSICGENYCENFCLKKRKNLICNFQPNCKAKNIDESIVICRETIKKL